MDFTASGFIELKHIKATGEVVEYAFHNAVTDYGLAYLLRKGQYSVGLPIQEMILSDSAKPIDVTDLAPAVDEHYLGSTIFELTDPVFANAGTSGVTTVATDLRYTASFIHPIDITQHGHRGPSKTYREISLMIAHPDHIWDGEYKAVFAKAKIKDINGAPVDITMADGDVIQITYTLNFAIRLTTELSTSRHEFGIDPNKRLFERLENPYYVVRNDYYPEDNPHRVIVSFRTPATTNFSFRVYAGVFFHVVDRATTLYLPNTDYHVIFDVSRVMSNVTDLTNLPDLVKITRVDNRTINVTGPSNLGIHLYHNNERVVSWTKRTTTAYTFTLPIETKTHLRGALETTKAVYNPLPLKDSEPLDVYLSVDGLGEVYHSTIAAPDTTPALIRLDPMPDPRTVVIYMERDSSFTYSLGGGKYKDFIMPPEWYAGEDKNNYWQYNNYGTDWSKWHQIRSLTLKPTDEELGEPHPENPRLFRYSFQLPFEMTPWTYITILMKDLAGNESSSGYIYTPRVDYQPDDFNVYAEKPQTLMPTGYTSNGGYDYHRHIPNDTVSTSFVLVHAVIEDIPNEE